MSGAVERVARPAPSITQEPAELRRSPLDEREAGECTDCPDGDDDDEGGGEVAMRPSAATRISAGAPAPSAVEGVVRSAGRPLDPGSRAAFGVRFGFDFSRVRVHDDAAAAASARSVGAEAYTVGRHVVFGAGRYAPASDAGRRLLAHELTHVMQQRDVTPGGRIRMGALDSPAEHAAHHAAGAGAAGHGGHRLAGALVQRQPTPGCIRLLNQRGRSDALIGQAMHAAIRRHFISQKGAIPSFAFPDASADPYRTDRRDRVIDPQVGGGARQGIGVPDLAYRSPRAGVMLIAEVKPANWLRFTEGEFQLGNYLAKGDSPDNDALRRRLRVTGFLPMTRATYQPPSRMRLPGRTYRVTWCGPGIIVYKELERAADKRKRKKEERRKRDRRRRQEQRRREQQRRRTGGHGAQARAYNFTLGLGINSSGAGGGNAGIGVAINSRGASVGTVSAGVVRDSEGLAVGTVGAGASSNSQSASALSAGAGSSSDTMSAGVANASAGSTEGGLTASAGTAGTGSSRDATGAAAGRTGHAGEGAEGGSRATAGEPQEGGGDGGSPGRNTGTAPGGGAGGQGRRQGDAGTGDAEAAGGAGNAQGRPGAPGGGSDTGGAAGQQGRPGGGTREGAGSGPGGDRAGGSTGGRAGAPADPNLARIVERLRLDAPGAKPGQLEKAVVDAARLDALVTAATPAQQRLLRSLAYRSVDGVYVVPEPAWIEMILGATAGLTEDELAALDHVEWRSNRTTEAKLRESIRRALAAKRRPAANATQRPGAQGATGTTGTGPGRTGPQGTGGTGTGTARRPGTGTGTGGPDPSVSGGTANRGDTGDRSGGTGSTRESSGGRTSGTGRGTGGERAGGSTGGDRSGGARTSDPAQGDRSGGRTGGTQAGTADGGRGRRQAYPLASTSAASVRRELEAVDWGEVPRGSRIILPNHRPPLFVIRLASGTRMGAVVTLGQVTSEGRRITVVSDASSIVTLDQTVDGDALQRANVNRSQSTVFLNEAYRPGSVVAEPEFARGLQVSVDEPAQ